MTIWHGAAFSRGNGTARLLWRLPVLPRFRLPRPRPLAETGELSASLRVARKVALAAIAIVVVTSTAVALAESYHGLYLWALHHSYTRAWARWFPLMVDAFVALGELSLFVAVIDRAPLRYRVYAWLVTFVGLSASVAGNVGHLQTATLSDRFTDAVPPLAAFVGLTVGLMNLKRVLARSGPPSGHQRLVADVLAALAASDTRAVVQTLVDVGISDTGTLAAIAGVTDRTVRRYKSPDTPGHEADTTGHEAEGRAAARARHASGTVPRVRRIRTESIPEPIS